MVAAGRVAQYLMGPPGRTRSGGAGSTVRYYSDSVEGAGWWSGQGAAQRGLGGEVGRKDLEALLAGRDPATGERIVSAAGSAGRRALRAGEATKEIGGVWVWGIGDLASRFDVDRASVVAAATGLGAGEFIADEDGTRWLSEQGVQAIAEELQVAEVPVASLDGDPSEVLSVAQCAGITGLSPQYLRRALERGEPDPEQDEDPKAWLVGDRAGERGRWGVLRGDLAAFVERRNPPAVRVAYDAVLTTEKSVSLLAMLGDTGTRSDCVDALLAANTVAMGWLEEHASGGRAKGSPIEGEGFTVGSFMHGSSRNLDPHPHVHNLIVNAMVDRNGQGRTLDGRSLYREAKAASAVATAELRWRLHQMGADFVQHRGGVWELAGVDEQTVDAFSSRRTEIDAAVAELIKDRDVGATRAEVQRVSASTRGAKQSIDPQELAVRWQAMAADIGFDAGLVTGRSGRASVAKASLDRDAVGELFTFLADGAEGACEGESTFNRGDVLAAINRWAPQGKLVIMPAEVTISLCERFLASERAIPVLGGSEVIRRRDGRPSAMTEQRWTTPSMIRRQAVIDALWTEGHEAGLARVDARIVDAACSAVNLSSEQRDLVRMWTTSGHQFQAAIGRPGTGKTYTMKAATSAWREAGLEVKGAAIKGTAAQALAAETEIEVETVAWYLNRWRRGDPGVDARTVLIVDEASTLSDRDLGELMAMATDTGAVLRLVGDPAQQQSVGAGGMWEAMLERHAVWTPELRQQRRLENREQAQAAEEIRSGEVARAFKTLAANGQLVVAEAGQEVLVLAVQRWLERRARGAGAPMVDRRNDTRQTLNKIAQGARVALGEIPAPMRVGARLLAVGDEVVATAPNREVANLDSGRYVANGSRGVITSINDNTIGVELEGVGLVDIGREWCATNLDLGYAVTAYGIQGATVDEISSIIRPGADLAGLYVSLTRGRHNNELLIAGQDPHEFGYQPDPDPLAEVAGSVNDRAWQPAVVADPGLLDTDLAGSSRHGRRNQGSGRAVAAQLARVRRAGIDQPGSLVAATLPPRPEVPFLAKDWDRVVGAMAEFRWRWSPEPVGSTTWTQALGRRSDGEREQDRQRIEKDMTVLSVTIGLRWLSDRAGPKVAADPVTIQVGGANAYALGLTELRRQHTPDPPNQGTIGYFQGTNGVRVGGVGGQGGGVSNAAQYLRDLQTDQVQGSPAGETHRVRQYALQGQPEWLITYLSDAAKEGRLARVDPDALASWVGDVAVFRSQHAIEGNNLLDPERHASRAGRELMAMDPSRAADPQRVVRRSALAR